MKAEIDRTTRLELQMRQDGGAAHAQVHEFHAMFITIDEQRGALIHSRPVITFLLTAERTGQRITGAGFPLCAIDLELAAKRAPRDAQFLCRLPLIAPR